MQRPAQTEAHCLNIDICVRRMDAYADFAVGNARRPVETPRFCIPKGLSMSRIKSRRLALGLLTTVAGAPALAADAPQPAVLDSVVVQG